MPKILEDEQIFSAVIQVVAERGYSGATTKQMADAAEVSEVTLFRKYGSKQEMVKQAISSIINQTDFATAAEYTGDLSADLTRIVQAYNKAAIEHGDFVSAVFLEMFRHPEIMDAIHEPLNIFMSIGKLLACYQDEGQLRTKHPLHLVAILLGPLMYSAMLQKAIPGPQLPRIELSDYVEDFLKGNQINPGRK